MAIRFDSAADGLSAPAFSTSRYTLASWCYISVDRNTFQTIGEVSIAAGTNFHQLQTLVDGTTFAFNDHTAAQIVTDGTTQAVGAWWFNAIIAGAAATTIYQMKEGAGSVTKVTSATLSESFTPDSILIANDIFSEFLNGRLRGFKMWTAELSDAEIALEAAQFAPVRTSGLWAYYKLKDVATMLLDSSGNGRTLTNPGSAGSWGFEPDPATVAEPTAYAATPFEVIPLSETIYSSQHIVPTGMTETVTLSEAAVATYNAKPTAPWVTVTVE